MQRLIRYVAFVVAAIMAVTGVLNSMPTYGIITPIGPFPAIILRPIFLGAAVFLVLANSPFTKHVRAKMAGSQMARSRS